MSLTFYDKDFANNYEELITYYPAFYQQVYEMQEILKAQGKLADGIESGIEQAYLNNFIDYADSETIEKLEIFLGMDSNKGKDLEMRRKLIKAHFIGFGKISATTLKTSIQSCIEANVVICFEPFNEVGDNALFIYVYPLYGSKETIYISDIELLMEKKLPAHITYNVVFRFPVEGSAKMYTGIGIAGSRKKIKTEVINYGME